MSWSSGDNCRVPAIDRQPVVGTMRIISWNLHGASVPGKATNEQQRQSWALMRDLGADLILAQEAADNGIPSWLTEKWTVVRGELGRLRKNWRWGSLIAARGGLDLRLHEPSLAHPWLAQLYDLVLVGEMTVPGNEPMIIASVHTTAMRVADWTKVYATSLNLSAAELGGIRRPECLEEPYLNDLAFTALARTIQARPFLVAGDWNTCRKYAGGSEFFQRAMKLGWVECHQGAEEKSFFGANCGDYQLDHAFCDGATARSIRSCKVLASENARKLSDHAPLVIELALWSPSGRPDCFFSEPSAG